VLATPIITRLYSPADMGLLGIFMAFVGFTSVGVSLRYEMPLVSVRDHSEAGCLLTTSLFLTVPISLLAGLILYAMIDRNLLTYNLLPAWSPLVAVFMLALIGIFSTLRYWAVRQGRYDVVGRALVSQGMGRAVVPIGMSLLHVGWIGLLVGEIASRIFGIERMMRIAWPAIIDSLRPFRLGYFVLILRRHWKSPAILLPSSLVDALAATIPLPLISHLFGPGPAGQFFLVQRLSSLPASLIASSVADVFHPAIADAHWNDSGNIREILLKVTKKLAIASVIIYIPTAIISPFAFGLIFGEEWYETGLCMAIISPLSMVSLVVSPVSRLLLVVDKMEVKFIFDFVGLVLPISGLFLGNYFGFSFLTCLMVYVFFHILANILYYYLIWRASNPFTAQAAVNGIL